MKRQRLLLAGSTLAVFAAVGCSQKQMTGPSVVESAPQVQHSVASAWELDRAGKSEEALAMYLNVLTSDPNNAWAKRRVEQLSVNMPVLAQRKMERVTGQPALTAEAIAAPSPQETIAKQESTRPRFGDDQTNETIQQVVAKQDAARPKASATTNQFSSWFENNAAAEPAPETAVAKTTPEPKEEQKATTDLSDEFEWATETPTPRREVATSSSKERKWFETGFEEDAPSVAEEDTAAAASNPTSTELSDEAVFAELDRRAEPFQKTAEKAAAAESPSKGAEPSYPWDSVHENRVVQASTEQGFEDEAEFNPFETLDEEQVDTKADQADIATVAFSQSSSEQPSANRLIDLCQDANTHVLGLVHRLESPLAAERRSALNELALLGNQGQTARLPVRLLFDDPMAIVSAEAAWTLWQIDGDAFQSVRKLAELIDSQDVATAEFAVQSLGLIGPDAVRAVPRLEQRLATANGPQRVRTAEALVRISPTHVPALQALIESSRYGQETERTEATYALAYTPDRHRRAIVPILVNALHDDEESVRTAAALTLGNFGHEAKEARLALEAASRYDTRAVRDAARATLACLPK